MTLRRGLVEVVSALILKILGKKLNRTRFFQGMFRSKLREVRADKLAKYTLQNN